MFRSIVAVLLLSLHAFAQEGLPDFIAFKSHTESFDNHYDYALKDGRVWFRPRRATQADPPGEWKLLGKEGLPFHAQGKEPGPARVVALSADATGLIAIGEDRRIYDTYVDDKGGVEWLFAWGWPWRAMPQPVYLPPAAEYRTWSYSLLNHEASYSEDIAGNPHTIKRIDTVYVLSADGRSIRFDDPWLPPNEFEFAFAGPERGRFVAVSMAVSGCTLLVMDRSGRMYTRMVDFDTLGGNPGIAYTYDFVRMPYRAEDEGHKLRGDIPFIFDLRTLPAEPWMPQPSIPGRFTDRLTVVTTGKGNAARELRVEGEDEEGGSGYWSKAVEAKAWTFVKTGQPITGKRMDPAVAVETARPFDEDLAGSARIYPPHQKTPYDVKAELAGFNTFFDPVLLRLYPEGREQPLELSLIIRPDVFPIRKGTPKRLLGAILPASIGAESEKAARALLGDARVQEVFIVVADDFVEIQSDRHARTDDRAYRLRFPRVR